MTPEEIKSEIKSWTSMQLIKMYDAYSQCGDTEAVGIIHHEWKRRQVHNHSRIDKSGIRRVEWGERYIKGGL